MAPQIARMSGVEVTGVKVCYHDVNEQPPASGDTKAQAFGQDAPDVDSDASSETGEVGDQWHEVDMFAFGQRGEVENVGPVNPVQALVTTHSYNQNLVRQFQELSSQFQGWRPVRGDGNCYYRAVLFAWLERSVGLGLVEPLQAFCAKLRPHREVPILRSSVKICRRLLKAWIKERGRCGSDAAVSTLLIEVADKFNKSKCDRAFILCLRYLLGDFLREHARDSVDGDLTYESWAMAISGATNIDDYIESNVMVMNMDAADHVQHVCPRVLCTTVRIVMVDRETANFNTIDYGGLAVPQSSAGQIVNTSGDLMSNSNLNGMQPEIFLLLKPGHYDILIPSEGGVGRLLHPEGQIGQNRRDSMLPGESSPSSNIPVVRRRAETQWRSLIRLTHDIQTSFTAVLQCLDEKIADELAAKRKRLGSCDESLFEGQLTSLLDPLESALKRFQSVPEDSPFSDEADVIGDAPSQEDLLPSLLAVLQGRQPAPPPIPGAARVPQASRAVAPGAQLAAHQFAPRARQISVPVEVPVSVVPPGVASQGPPRAASVLGPGVPVTAPKIHQGLSPAPAVVSVTPVIISSPALARMGPAAASPLSKPADQEAVPPPSVPVLLAAPVPPPSVPVVASASPQDLECCICMEGGATAVAHCSCAYHISCLREYAQGEGQRAEKLCCHIHEQPLGAAFVLEQLPGFVPPRSPSPRRIPSPRRAPSPMRPSDALSQATGIGPATMAQLAAAGVIPGTGAVQDTGPRSASTWVTPQKFSDSNPFAMGSGLLASGQLLPPPSAHHSPRRRAPSVPRSACKVPRTGNLGAALGVPCVICFTEDGTLKTLHCSYKVHVECLKGFWTEKVVTLGRLKDIKCPAEVTGCTQYLNDTDLRGVVETADLEAAERQIEENDEQNRALIEEFRRQEEEYRPMFECMICLVEHEVEGSCTLPCQHRFCWESLQYHFDIIVKERRLQDLKCPAIGCGFNLRSEEHIHIFQQCLEQDSFDKLLEFLTRDDPHIYDCRHLGCEERVFLDDADDYADLQCARGHQFCAKCDCGPHAGISCDAQQERLEAQKKDEHDKQQDEEAFTEALRMGWKPCPKRCASGGGYKADEECDHVTCQCGHEFCWACGVTRQVALLHDNRWHKPSCPYHTRYEEVNEAPKHLPNCPECQKMPNGEPCAFPPDDGYPDSYVKRLKKKKSAKQPVVE